ncbi:MULTISPECIES: hypothetical protein [Actinoplanes]|uniref:hypothetical protein n=1 Tax=Actinoplanes TaxID=1865 RepID=UPI0009F897CC
MPTPPLSAASAPSVPVPTPPPSPPAGVPGPRPGVPAESDENKAERSPQRPVRNGYRRPPSGGGGNGDERDAERGLRGLVGSGSSQVSVGAALRARDASRPTDEQFAEAERDLPIVRRNWTPREDLPRR